MGTKSWSKRERDREFSVKRITIAVTQNRYGYLTNNAICHASISIADKKRERGRGGGGERKRGREGGKAKARGGWKWFPAVWKPRPAPVWQPVDRNFRAAKRVTESGHARCAIIASTSDRVHRWKFYLETGRPVSQTGSLPICYSVTAFLTRDSIKHRPNPADSRVTDLLSFLFFSFNCTQNFLLFRTFESFRPIHNTMEKWKIARVRCLWVKFYSWGRMENWAREYVENEWNLSKGANFCQIFHFWPLTRKLIWNWE